VVISEVDLNGDLESANKRIEKSGRQCGGQLWFIGINYKLTPELDQKTNTSLG
jgi:hypothetical protein